MSRLNKIIKANLITLLSFGLSTAPHIALAITQDDASCFLDWVAYRLPELQLTTVQGTLNNGETALREYTAPGFGAGGIFIGIIDSEIFAVHSGIAAGSFMDYGEASDFIQIAKSENCGYTPPAPTPPYSLINNYSKEECVKDNNTGLIWEGKSSDPSDKRYFGWNYTNYEEICRQTPCPILSPYEGTNAIGYKKYVNDMALCGYKNWRLPTVDELKTLIQSGTSPAIDTNWFPNTSPSWYITSTPDASRYDFSWGVNFIAGEFNPNNDRSLPYSIRLVR
jgi:hypothetical protein